MEQKTTFYGDLLLTFDTTKKIPEVEENSTQIIVIRNAPSDFKHAVLRYFIGSTELHGNIFGNFQAFNRFPILHNGVLLRSSAVIFGKFEDRTFCVLVQVKNSSRVMNVAGHMNRDDKDVAQTAAREIQEETLLQVDLKTWKPVSYWKSKLRFAGLDFISHTEAGVCWIQGDFPLTWISQIKKRRKKIIFLPVDNEEVKEVILFDMAFFKNIRKLEFSSQFGGHELHLLMEAALLEHIIDKPLDPIEKFPYLIQYHSHTQN